MIPSPDLPFVCPKVSIPVEEVFDVGHLDVHRPSLLDLGRVVPITVR